MRRVRAVGGALTLLFAADRSTFLDAKNVSLGGYRPDHWAMAFGLVRRL